ncbi:site-specific DNA-methyltransferase [Proteiniclasticum ruminis]|uniref:Adenine-specific DNA-methyltransferase n=1 Tax=Proteiniclasticum ruminis TaxID=398199 RepID=A0A1G8RF15_9CLOT|nr:site-specific DNA-methyltransferase [Proteiniclasticum ruminis]SDJ15521.1 adenine-specific DNA-methyltransferase [Proteiniclasticum ruminis]
MNIADKMKFETPNLTAENIEKLATLFPSVVVEGKVNIDLLRSMLGEGVFTDEAYEFTWVGKRAAIAEAGKPIRKTLRPCPEESKNWDTTENLYIEGDNLEVLKLLQESYLGKVKMIYIDPPYNTGNDFIYLDDFSKSLEEYEEESGLYDEVNNRLVKNAETNGRFHSDWCSMMYPRFVLARNLLSDDGVIFISIDENEIHNSRKMCDEILGVSNFIGCIANINNPKGRSDDKYIATAHEYLLVYAKNITTLTWYGFEPTEEITKRYNKIDAQGRKYREIDLRKTGENDLREDRPNLFYYFHYNEQTGDLYPTTEKNAPQGFISIFPQREDGKEGNWRWGLNTANKQISDLVAKFMPTRRVWGIMQKDYLEGRSLVKPTTSWTFKDVNSERGTEQFIDLGFDKRIFPKPKPLGTIERILRLSTSHSDIVLDFFSGSSTTAHAVMRLNAEDGGNRQFIMVQLPECADEKSDAYKAGYVNICEIGKERIRRAGDKIKAEAGLTAQNLDIGFRVLKLDETNMNDVYYAAGDYTQDMISMLQSNIKEDRTDMDLLFGCLLDWGLPLSLPHTHEKIDGFTVHTYNEGDLIACFEERITEKVVREIASRQPLRVVFRDSSFTSSPEKINVVEIFKLLAPNTTVRVI